jgi:hypothetical protein
LNFGPELDWVEIPLAAGQNEIGRDHAKRVLEIKVDTQQIFVILGWTARSKRAWLTGIPAHSKATTETVHFVSGGMKQVPNTRDDMAKNAETICITSRDLEICFNPRKGNKNFNY